MQSGPATAAWRELAARAERLAAAEVATLSPTGNERFDLLSAEAEGLLLDYSRQRLDAAARDALLRLADEVQLRAAIEAMYQGDAVNVTENRAALHVALRQPPGAGLGGHAIERQVLDERARMLEFAERVRAGEIRGARGAPFATVVNIGIGGSDLGPAMAVEALRPYVQGAPRVEFVSNVDGCALLDLCARSDPATTLFVVASKTFTTQETITNARSARAWIEQSLGTAAVPAHFAAVSVNSAAMNDFGVHPEHRFRMWDWVGGRYSLWSSIGLPLAIAIGRQNFLALLGGAHALDRHFRDAPWERNLPVLMAVLAVWNNNFLGLPTLAVLPYDSRLARFPAFLQQLEMESLGKSVRRDGTAVDCATGTVVWGEPGNNAQHSFFQLLHQGTARAALDFLLPVRSSCGRQDHQDLAIANCLAQAEAFWRGQRGPGVSPHREHPGGRPSSIVLFERLDPATLGKLIALYEHKVYAQSVIWGVNAFDQFGVELGKTLAQQMLPAVEGTGAPADRGAGGLASLLARIRQLRGQGP
ncbi:MAG: glucose-6-phosphate isomerase [Steroidobacteraceae bacterium]|nr:glucose-6-phosphate isomerase [Steroidobacteraceae bacterium]